MFLNQESFSMHSNWEENSKFIHNVNRLDRVGKGAIVIKLHQRMAIESCYNGWLASLFLLVLNVYAKPKEVHNNFKRYGKRKALTFEKL